MNETRVSFSIGPNEYVTPMLRVPVSRLLRSFIRSRHSLAESSVCCARGRSSIPASVSDTLWLVLENS